MPCHTALMKDVLHVAPDDTVESVLPKLAGNADQYAVVVDEQGILQGYISHGVILKNLLPVSVAAQDGIDLGLTINAAPGAAKRLKSIKPLPVSDIMERKLHKRYPDTPTWEGVTLLVQHGAPVFIVEQGSDKLIGVMNEHSILEDFERMNNEN